MPDEDLQPPQAAYARKHKGTLKISDIGAENNGSFTHSVQQVDFLFQPPDEIVFVLVSLQQPGVLLTLPGQLLNTCKESSRQREKEAAHDCV